MKVIGLVGGIASGKTTVASVLEGLGAFVINADKLGHEAYRPGEQCYEKLIAEFGAEILKDDRERTIDRKALGDKVFGPKNKSRMETLTGMRPMTVAKVVKEEKVVMQMETLLLWLLV